MTTNITSSGTRERIFFSNFKNVKRVRWAEHRRFGL